MPIQFPIADSPDEPANGDSTQLNNHQRSHCPILSNDLHPKQSIANVSLAGRCEAQSAFGRGPIIRYIQFPYGFQRNIARIAIGNHCASHKRSHSVPLREMGRKSDVTSCATLGTVQIP